MKTFLFELAEEINKSYANLSEVTVVFPNRRAALYFRKYVGQLLTKPVFSPKLITFEDFVSDMSALRIPDRLELIFKLHQCYVEVMGDEAETFDQFFMWGDMLLRDFDEVDRYLVDAKILFSDLSHLKELDSNWDYLTAEQKDFLKKFWIGFDAEESINKRKFVDVWRKLFPLYTTFNERLFNEGLAYEGRQHRLAAEMLTSGKLKLDYQKNQVWFIGFNALTKAEEKIISYLVDQQMASVRWDTDQYYINDEKQEAGIFFRAHKQHPLLAKEFSLDLPDHFKKEKTIDLFSAAQPMGQVKLMAQVLTNQLKNGMLPEETVVILPDEKMLMPVMHSIAPVVDKFNVTMGFPLASSPVFNLVELLLELQIGLRKNYFAFNAVHSVLSHPYVTAADPANAQGKLKEIQKHNWVSVPENFLTEQVPLHALIFKKADKITTYLLTIFEYINTISSLDELDQEYVFRGVQLLNRLDAVWSVGTKGGNSLPLKSFLRLFRQYARSEKIPFIGEPLKGLQVMGVLESRNLDFKNVFILSLNEGIFPTNAAQGSYIPYNIRKAYGLPTAEHQGAIYAYLFYRALQRAQNIFLFYNSEPDVLGQGEMSRYVQQLIYESGHKVKHQVLHNSVQPRPQEPIEIKKDEQVLRALAKLNEGNLRARGLSPSALNTYFDCQLKFYFQYVTRIREQQKIQEEIDPRILGNLLHAVMEQFYKQILEKKPGKVIDADDFDNIDHRLKKLIDEAFIKTYHLNPKHEVVYEGQRVVVREVVKKFAKQILEYDREYAPFKIEALEQNGWLFNVKIDHSPGFATLGGTIDRIDSKDGRVRVIDYKTGKDDLNFKGVESLFLRDGKRNKAAFQTLVYALLYKNNNSTNGQKVIPGLLNRVNLFDENFTFGLKMGDDYLHDATPLFPQFEALLKQLLEEIFDPTKTFVQTNRVDTCKLCAYKEICYR
ncbi:MAG: PD-(D/E)XK nuclease family protein [Bacteroidetes bacterium]|nr:PD-(D/E)XK nuclease family protein [Bacteroidota bacterium]